MRDHSARSWLSTAPAIFLLLVATQGAARADLLSINALNDRPGPVDIVVHGEDITGTSLFTTTLSWTADGSSRNP